MGRTELSGMRSARAVAVQKLQRTICGLALAATLAGPVAAEPGPTITYLMEQEISQFSFGLLRLQMMLDRGLSREDFWAGADYDWDRNRLVVSPFWIMQDRDATKDDCRKMVNKIRSLLGIKLETGRPYGDGPSSLVDYFRPLGYALKNEPKDMGQKLDQVVVIQAEAWGKAVSVECEAQLLGTDILFKE